MYVPAPVLLPMPVWMPTWPGQWQWQQQPWQPSAEEVLAALAPLCGTGVGVARARGGGDGDVAAPVFPEDASCEAKVESNAAQVPEPAAAEEARNEADEECAQGPEPAAAEDAGNEVFLECDAAEPAAAEDVAGIFLDETMGREEAEVEGNLAKVLEPAVAERSEVHLAEDSDSEELENFAAEAAVAEEDVAGIFLDETMVAERAEVHFAEDSDSEELENIAAEAAGAEEDTGAYPNGAMGSDVVELEGNFAHCSRTEAENPAQMPKPAAAEDDAGFLPDEDAVGEGRLSPAAVLQSELRRFQEALPGTHAKEKKWIKKQIARIQRQLGAGQRWSP